MREAAYHSAAQSSHLQGPSQNIPSQLDPGSLYDVSRRRASKTGYANSLLKQAIANRLKPSAADGEPQATSPPGKIHKTDSDMAKSMLLNAAWYRDDQGRTGFKSKEWDQVPNAQKDVVKSNPQNSVVDDSSPGTQIKNIDMDLLHDDGAKKKSKHRRKKEDSREEENSAEGQKSDYSPEGKSEAEAEMSPKKLSKEEKKAVKERAKEEKRREKAEKKASKEKMKLERKMSKTSEKNKEIKTFDDQGTVGETSEASHVAMQKQRSTAKAEATIEVRLKAREKERERIKKETTSSPKSSEVESFGSPTSLRFSPAVDQRRPSTESQSSSQQSRITVNEVPIKVIKDSSERNKAANVSVKEIQRMDDNTDGKRRHHSKTVGKRRDSSMSESSRVSYNSHKSVTFNENIQMHEIERRETGSSSEEEEEDDDAAIMSDDELSKPDTDRRRRLVRILQEQHDDERQLTPEDQRQRDIYDDDLEDFEEQERLALIAMEQGYHPSLFDDGETSSQQSFYAEDVEGPDRYLMNEDGSFITLDHLPYSVRRAIIADLQGRGSLDQPTMGSMSRLHGEGGSAEGSLIGFPPLPRSASGYFEPSYSPDMNFSYKAALYQQQQAQALSADAVQQPRGLGLYQSSNSEQSKNYGRHLDAFLPSSSQQVDPMHTSYYENLLENKESENRDKRSPCGSLIESSQETPVPSPPRKSSNASLGSREQFFSTMYQAAATIGLSPTGGRSPRSDRRPSNELANVKLSPKASNLPSVTASPLPPGRAGQPAILITSSTFVETTTKKTEVVEKEEKLKEPQREGEDEMRRKFVARFGAGRKAPIAGREEDPADPEHVMGSRESVSSTDSRESVVSAASVKAENLARRNFNY